MKKNDLRLMKLHNGEISSLLWMLLSIAGIILGVYTRSSLLIIIFSVSGLEGVGFWIMFLRSMNQVKREEYGNARDDS